MVKYKILITLIVLLSFLSVANADYGEYLEEIGCEQINGFWHCLEPPSYNTDIPITFLEDVSCYSTQFTFTCSGSACAEIMDTGCFSRVEITSDTTVTLDYKKFTSQNSSEHVDIEKTLKSGEIYEVFIESSLIDYEKCSKATETYTTLFDTEGTKEYLQCTYLGESLLMGATVGPDTLLVREMSQPAGIIDLTGENMIYLALIIIIIIIAYWTIFSKKKSGGKPRRRPRRYRRRGKK